MNTFNIFAILLIVTCVNTSKSISYSDIAQSLTQLHDVPTEALGALNEVTESFADSHKNLEAVIAVNGDMCEKLEGVAKTVSAALAARVKATGVKIVALAASSTANTEIITTNVASQKAEVLKIKEAAADLKKEALNLIKKEAELGETINVLERLKNIANDELAGKTQIKTEMGKYKVVNANGVSFIQRANLKEELHALLSKSHTASKSLISTLIMIASNDDGHYSNPKIVAKIIAVLDKIIASNALKRDNLKTEFAKDSAMNQEIIENAAEMVANLKEGSIKAESRVELNGKETLMYQRDLTYFAGAATRRASRIAFNTAFCAKQKAMMVVYQSRYAMTAKRLQEIRAEISA